MRRADLPNCGDSSCYLKYRAADLWRDTLHWQAFMLGMCVLMMVFGSAVHALWPACGIATAGNGWAFLKLRLAFRRAEAEEGLMRARQRLNP